MLCFESLLLSLCLAFIKIWLFLFIYTFLLSCWSTKVNKHGATLVARKICRSKSKTCHYSKNLSPPASSRCQARFQSEKPRNQSRIRLKIPKVWHHALLLFVSWLRRHLRIMSGNSSGSQPQQPTGSRRTLNPTGALEDSLEYSTEAVKFNQELINQWAANTVKDLKSTMQRRNWIRSLPPKPQIRENFYKLQYDYHYRYHYVKRCSLSVVKRTYPLLQLSDLLECRRASGSVTQRTCIQHIHIACHCWVTGRCA